MSHDSSVRMQLARIVTTTRPFGPTNAAEIDNPDIARYFFDGRNKIYDDFRFNPTIVIGRRGSGKTAYLQSEYFAAENRILLQLRIEKAFARVLAEMERSLQGAIFAESVADLWNTVLHIILFDHVVHHNDFSSYPFGFARDYLAKIGAGRGKTVDDFLWKVVDAIARHAAGKTVGMLAELLKVFDTVTFEDARADVFQALHDAGRGAMLLIDSLDELPLDANHFPHTLSGLLKCVGTFNRPNAPFGVRFCLPAELYHAFMRISSHPLKDFENSVAIQWHPRELLAIAAQRVKLYAEVHEPGLWDRLRRLNPDEREDAGKIIEVVFPEMIRNRRGVQEPTVAYILRHTQLLPRQMLTHLNEIGQRHLKGHSSIVGIGNEAIVEGIRAMEGRLVQEIFSGFKGR